MFVVDAIAEDLRWAKGFIGSVSFGGMKRKATHHLGRALGYHHPSMVNAWPADINGPTAARALEFLTTLPGVTLGPASMKYPAVVALKLSPQEVVWFKYLRKRFQDRVAEAHQRQKDNKKLEGPKPTKEEIRDNFLEGLRQAVERDGGRCIDCGEPVYIFPPHTKTFTTRSGDERNMYVDEAYSPDRWNELRGYTLENTLWRCTCCNLGLAPKLNAERECGCCKKRFRMGDWSPVQ